jgi:hypothetical protein
MMMRFPRSGLQAIVWVVVGVASWATWTEGRAASQGVGPGFIDQVLSFPPIEGAREMRSIESVRGEAVPFPETMTIDDPAVRGRLLGHSEKRRHRDRP